MASKPEFRQLATLVNLFLQVKFSGTIEPIVKLELGPFYLPKASSCNTDSIVKNARNWELFNLHADYDTINRWDQMLSITGEMKQSMKPGHETKHRMFFHNYFEKEGYFKRFTGTWNYYIYCVASKQRSELKYRITFYKNGTVDFGMYNMAASFYAIYNCVNNSITVDEIELIDFSNMNMYGGEWELPPTTTEEVIIPGNSTGNSTLNETNVAELLLLI